MKVIDCDYIEMIPAGIYLLKVCFFFSKLTIETLEQGMKYVNFDHNSHLVLVILLLTLNKQLPVWIAK